MPIDDNLVPARLILPDGRRIGYIRLVPKVLATGAQGDTVSEARPEPVKPLVRPEVMWLGGFRSDMRGSKADAMHEWCAARGLGFTRFDYSGHGASEGEFGDGTISRWLEESQAIFREVTQGPQILVGSSMGAWLALLLMSRLVGRQTGDARKRIAGAVLIAPAWDMTERLMWGPAPDEIKAELMEKGIWYRPSAYDDEPYPISLGLIEDGRNHLISGKSFDPGWPVRIIHGLQDEDVPWQGSVSLMELLDRDDVRLTLVKDAEHRLSREQDLRLLMREVGELAS